jgi:hypothetical protein
VKKENLTAAMFTGVKQVPEAAVHERREDRRDSAPRRAASREHASAYFVSPWRAFALLLLAAILVSLVVRGPA